MAADASDGKVRKNLGYSAVSLRVGEDEPYEICGVSRTPRSRATVSLTVLRRGPTTTCVRRFESWVRARAQAANQGRVPAGSE
jgi:hypothetical protein